MGNKTINIKKFVKRDKNLVIDIDDVEYLINDEAIEAIEKGSKNIPLIQLYDGQTYLVNIKEIKNSLLQKGAIDYLNKKSYGSDKKYKRCRGK